MSQNVLHKRFVKKHRFVLHTLVFVSNCDHKSGLGRVRFESWAPNPDLKRFGLSCGSRILLIFKWFLWFLWIQIILLNPQYYTQKRILTNKSWIQFCKSESLDLFWNMIDKSNLVNLKIQSLQKVWIVSIHKNSYKNPANSWLNQNIFALHSALFMQIFIFINIYFFL